MTDGDGYAKCGAEVEDGDGASVSATSDRSHAP